MLPPHCGQTRLMIDEMMLALDSPGSVSMCSIVDFRTQILDIDPFEPGPAITHNEIAQATRDLRWGALPCSKKSLQICCQSGEVDKFRFLHRSPEFEGHAAAQRLAGERPSAVMPESLVALHLAVES